MVPGGASVAVVASYRNHHMDTARQFVAIVFSTWIPVVTVGRSPCHTGTTVTLVPNGTSIPILAGQGVVFVFATSLRFATVVGAQVPVVAVGRHSTRASAFLAGLANGAGVAVVAS